MEKLEKKQTHEDEDKASEESNPIKLPDDDLQTTPLAYDESINDHVLNKIEEGEIEEDEDHMKVLTPLDMFAQI